MQIDFMIVSLDPKNDTPEAWQQYRISREVDRSNWHLLTGSEATTKAIRQSDRDKILVHGRAYIA